MTAITVRGLRTTYAGKAAVDSLDLDIGAGECFALLGPNGAGKTTTVEILEGFRARDAGEVSVLGVDPGSAGLAWRDRVGIVLQSSTGLDLLTPREVLRSTAKAYRRPRDIDEVIDATGLTEKADDRVGRLSGGQRRRLDVATTGFDPQARRDFWSLISSLSSDGTTVLLTTHYLDEAEHLADRVGVIAGGRLLALDTPSALGGRSEHEAVVSWDEGGERHQVSTATPTAEVARLAERLGAPPVLTYGLIVRDNPPSDMRGFCAGDVGRVERSFYLWPRKNRGPSRNRGKLSSRCSLALH